MREDFSVIPDAVTESKVSVPETDTRADCSASAVEDRVNCLRVAVPVSSTEMRDESEDVKVMVIVEISKCPDVTEKS